MPNISAREVAAVLLWAALIAIVTSVPYMIAQSWAGPKRLFSGFIWGVDEGNVYLSWIRQYSEGNLFAANQYTTRLQRPHFFNVFLFALGRLCRVSGLTPLQAYHISRLLAIPFALYAFYCLLSHLTAIRLVRWAGLVIASLSSGLGWIFVLMAWQGWRPALHPIDCAAGWQAMPEAITFPTLMLNPLFAVSIGLMCLTILWGWRAMEQDSGASAVIAGLLLLVLGNVHSYDIFPTHAALVLWAGYLVATRKISLWQALKRYATIWLLALPSPAWAWYAAHADPAYMAKVNTPTFSPRLVDYLAGYGLLVPAAAIGVYMAWLLRRYHPRLLAPVFWAASHFALAYAPVPFQRKMMEGCHLPLSFLAAVGVALALPWRSESKWPRDISPNERWRRRARVVGAFVLVFVILTTPSNVVFVIEALGHVAVNNADLISVLMPPVYLTADEVQALEWLGRNSEFSDVVVCSSLIGNHIPAWAPARVYAGHWAETLDFPAAVSTVASFFAPGLLPQARAELLEQMGATYVWWGQYERLLQRAMLTTAERVVGHPIPLPDPPNRGLSWLKPVFSNETVTIFRCQRG